MKAQLVNLRKTDSFVNVPDSVEGVTEKAEFLEYVLRQYKEGLITEGTLMNHAEWVAGKILQACGWSFHPLA